MSKSVDLAFASLTEQSQLLDNGDLTSAALIDIYLDRIQTFDGELHSFIALYADEAREAAIAADDARKKGDRTGPLHGIPLALKDIIDMQDRVTTGGSRVWAERRPGKTATLAKRAIQAGMIVIGKTHTVEFAMGSFGTNQHMGHPKNPWDKNTHRAAGGSSSGSGVSVAAGLVSAAIGTDTGGSVRIPSSWCGLTGLKTTIGRISVNGVLPLASTLDTPGPMCRSVEDAALVFCALAGPDPMDRLTLRVPSAPDPFPTINHGVSGLTLGRIPDRELDLATDEVAAAYRESLAILARAGAEIVDFDPPESFTTMGTMVGEIISAEGHSFVGHLTDDPDAPVDNDVRPRINAGRDMSAGHYFGLLRRREELRLGFDRAMTGIDAFLTPTTADPALVVDEIDQTGTAAGFTRVVNLIDYCALTVPNGLTSLGLPTGLQIVARGYDESMALRIGQHWQSETDWHQKRPGAFSNS